MRPFSTLAPLRTVLTPAMALRCFAQSRSPPNRNTRRPRCERPREDGSAEDERGVRKLVHRRVRPLAAVREVLFGSKSFDSGI